MPYFYLDCNSYYANDNRTNNKDEENRTWTCIRDDVPSVQLGARRNALYR